ncbi:putative membrane protein [Bordetella holmesii 41130]|nr:putative membrane protein [Bordetella holmesii 41130]
MTVRFFVLEFFPMNFASTTFYFYFFGFLKPLAEEGTRST